MLALSIVVAPLPTGVDAGTQAVAATSGFDPGNIISDEIFFAGGAMTTAQVKAFLKAKVPSCAATSSTLPCLKSYKQNTPVIAKDSFCKKYKGSTNQSAASIITRVAKACNVSPKVLLVLLQKEQSLVTSTAPTEYKYIHATGFACPDTAPCNPAYAGFFYQVYYAARQYQRYANDPSYSWRQLGVNTLQYHPDKSRCGTVEVNVRNKATLGLYFYTPYVPNAAALAAGYGQVATGNGASCASYGNRNFWALFNDWFGSTQIPVTGAIQAAWIAQGAVDGARGAPTSRAVCDTSGAYCLQSFKNGMLAATKKHGAFVVSGTAPYTAWRAAGGQSGALGFPYSKATCRTSDASCLQRFTGGYAVTSAKGAYAVTGVAAKVWRKAGARSGALGLPKKNMTCKKSGVCVQKFSKGRITVHPSFGARTVTGNLATYWIKKKAQKGAIGWPVTASSCTTSKKVTTCRQQFSKMWVVSTSKGKNYRVRGAIATTWAKKFSRLKYPVANRSCKKSGKKTTCVQHFTKGWVVTHTGRKTFIVKAEFSTTWRKNLKKVGYPTSARTCTKKKGTKVCTQKFSKGKITQRGSHKPKAAR